MHSKDHCTVQRIVRYGSATNCSNIAADHTSLEERSSSSSTSRLSSRPVTSHILPSGCPLCIHSTVNRSIFADGMCSMVYCDSVDPTFSVAIGLLIEEHGNVSSVQKSCQ